MRPVCTQSVCRKRPCNRRRFSFERNIHVMFIYLCLIFTWFSQPVDNMPAWAGIGQRCSQVGECDIAGPRSFPEGSETAHKCVNVEL